MTRDPRALLDDTVRVRLDHYAKSLEMLQETAPDLALVRQLRFELWALEELPPRG